MSVGGCGTEDRHDPTPGTFEFELGGSAWSDETQRYEFVALPGMVPIEYGIQGGQHAWFASRVTAAEPIAFAIELNATDASSALVGTGSASFDASDAAPLDDGRYEYPPVRVILDWAVEDLETLSLAGNVYVQGAVERTVSATATVDAP